MAKPILLQVVIGAGFVASCHAASPPVCASACAAEAIAGEFGCGVNDLACSCNPPASNKYLACVQAACSSGEVQEFEAWAKGECAGYMHGSSAATTTPAAGGSSQSQTQATNGSGQSPTQAAKTVYVTGSPSGGNTVSGASATPTTSKNVAFSVGPLDHIAVFLAAAAALL